MKIEVMEYRRQDGVLLSRSDNFKEWSIRMRRHYGIFWNIRLRQWQHVRDIVDKHEDIYVTEKEGLKILKTIPKVKL